MVQSQISVSDLTFIAGMVTIAFGHTDGWFIILIAICIAKN